jgi:mRNA interferase RelE/StbE
VRRLRFVHGFTSRFRGSARSWGAVAADLIGKKLAESFDSRVALKSWWPWPSSWSSQEWSWSSRISTTGPYELGMTRPARRAISELLAEDVAAAAVEFITGPLLEARYRVGKPLRDTLSGFHSAWLGTDRLPRLTA